MTEEKFNELIEILKNDFEGDNSYMSGVNDGMYHLKRKLQELNIFAVSNSVCSICFGKGNYTTGGSFGGAVQTHKCSCCK